MLKLFKSRWILIGCDVFIVHQLGRNRFQQYQCQYHYSLGVCFPILIKVEWLLKLQLVVVIFIDLICFKARHDYANRSGRNNLLMKMNGKWSN